MGFVEEFASEVSLPLTGVLGGEKKTVTLVLKRCTITENSLFAAWCGDNVMEQCKRVAAAIPEDGRKHAIVWACETIVRDCGYGGKEFLRQLLTPMGIAKMMHLLLSKEQQRELSVLEIAGLLIDTSEQELSAIVNKVNGVTVADTQQASANPLAAETQSLSTGERSSLTSRTA